MLNEGKTIIVFAHLKYFDIFLARVLFLSLFIIFVHQHNITHIGYHATYLTNDKNYI